MIKIPPHVSSTCCIAMLFLLTGQQSAAQADGAPTTTRPLFAGDATLAITIEAPLSSVMRNRDETEEFPAVLRYADADGSEHSLEIGLRVRGKFRRQRDICDFAPLRVNFKKKQVEGSVFAGQNTIKLVTDCEDSNKKYQQFLLKEYLAYKIYTTLTDVSMRARLLRVTYVDTDKDKKSRESYAFFIEEKEHIADRLGMELIKIPRTKYEELDPAQSNLVNVYEYFIGNTDFSLIAGPKDSDCCHNTILYQKAGGPYLSVPYDFDHAGIVDAPYALPNPKFKIKSVTQRLYRGRCDNNALLNATVQQFVAKRAEITRLVEQLDGFDDRSIKGTLSYIDSFYKDVSDEKSIDKNLMRKCS